LTKSIDSIDDGPIRRCPVSKSHIATSKSAHIGENGNEEQDNQGTKLEHAEYILEFTVNTHSKCCYDAEKSPEDQVPCPRWDLAIWNPELQNENRCIPV
jgi:hypothetical protein